MSFLYRRNVRNGFYDYYKIVDFNNENNKYLLQQIEDIIDSPSFPGYNEYRIIRNFLINISNEVVVTKLLGDYDKWHYFKENGNNLIKDTKYLLSSWRLENAINVNYVFRAVLNNPSMKEYLSGVDISKNKAVYELKNLFNWYKSNWYSYRQAKDPSSIIFNKELSYLDSSIVKRIIEIDSQLNSNNRKAILFDEDGKIKKLRDIENNIKMINLKEGL